MWNVWKYHACLIEKLLASSNFLNQNTYYICYEYYNFALQMIDKNGTGTDPVTVALFYQIIFSQKSVS